MMFLKVVDYTTPDGRGPATTLMGPFTEVKHWGQIPIPAEGTEVPWREVFEEAGIDPHYEYLDCDLSGYHGEDAKGKPIREARVFQLFTRGVGSRTFVTDHQVYILNADGKTIDRVD